MNVLYLNDYSIETIYKGVGSGTQNAAHLWGYDFFSKYETTSYVPLNARIYSFQKRIFTYKFLGDLQQEVKVFLQRKDVDLIIAANITLVWGLGYLKRLIKLPPILGILHSVPQSTNWFYKIFIKCHLGGIEKIICITKKDYIFLKDILHMPENKIRYIPWAVNLEDYDKISQSITNEFHSNGKYIISIGKSKRDYQTLIGAFRQIRSHNFQLKIYCGKLELEKISEEQIHIYHRWIEFPDCVKEYKKAEFIVIPLIKSDRTLGLTSMFDAMGMAKAFIITRNPGIDIDVEKERVGLWVEPGNINDMKNKISFLLNNPAIAKQYGENGKKYLERKYNYKKFCQRLYNLARATYEEHFLLQSRHS